MADEPENPVVVLLRQLGDKIDRVDEKVDRVAADQQTARANSERTDRKIDRMGGRLDHIATQSNRAARRADDVMASQSRIQTDIAAIRAHLEDGERRLVDEFRQDTEQLTFRVDDLTDRVERLETPKS